MFQASYKSSDVPFPTLKSMSNAIVKQVLPEAKPHRISLHEGSLGYQFCSVCLLLTLTSESWSTEMDGDQVLDFYWIDPIAAAIRYKTINVLYPSQSLPGNSTQSTSGRTLCAGQESEPLAGPIQGWFFNLHNSLTLSALHCYSCSMPTKHFLASTDPTIQSIVSL